MKFIYFVLFTVVLSVPEKDVLLLFATFKVCLKASCTCNTEFFAARSLIACNADSSKKFCSIL